jgi:thymidylate synthase ThyX
MYQTKILADSISDTGVRLTTFELTFPRIVLAEFNTHRMFSRNSASSRAIPVERMLDKVQKTPFVPIYWGKNQKGMSADIELEGEDVVEATKLWMQARDDAVCSARWLISRGVHKQITNRLLEPFMWHTVICTATDWENAINLRAHKDAQPEIRPVFEGIRDALFSSTPDYLPAGKWHLPLVPDLPELVAAGYNIGKICLISVGRCARVSYLTHAGQRDPEEDIALARRLKSSGHMSPFEHVALSTISKRYFGNFFSWFQFRKTIKDEAVYRC